MLGIGALGYPDGPAAAQDRSAEAFLRCTAETDEAERLACFDRVARQQAPEATGEAAADAAPPPASPADAETPVVAPAGIAPAAAPVPDAPPPAPAAALSTAPSAATVKPAEAPAPKAPPAKVAESMPDSQPAPLPDPAPPVEVGPEPPEEEVVGPPEEASGDFTAIVRRVARQPRGEHVVYLENGQVWAENFANSYFPVEVGDTVTLRKRRFGGYRLISESGRAVEVKRLR